MVFCLLEADQMMLRGKVVYTYQSSSGISLDFLVCMGPSKWGLLLGVWKVGSI